MITKIWNGPVTQFFGGKARTYADEPYVRNVEMSKAFEAPYSQPVEMTEAEYNKAMPEPYKKGGKIKMSSGGYTQAADGIAQRGKTRGKMC